MLQGIAEDMVEDMEIPNMHVNMYNKKIEDDHIGPKNEGGELSIPIRTS